VALSGLDDGRAIKAMSLAMQSSCEVSGAAHLPGGQTLLRLEGIRPSVISRRDKLCGLLKEFGAAEILGEKQSRTRWIAVRDVHLLSGDQTRAVWKLSVTPSQGAEIVRKISGQIDVMHFFDWAGGLIWLSVPAADDASASIVRDSFEQGHATLIRAPEAVRARVDVFQPQAAALAGLSARVKASFDPGGVLNFGRMYRDQ
jgi:glycolate oxidase FAD binding subunit